MQTNGNPNDLNTPDHPYNLQRFVEAQVATFSQARAELLAGQKQSHWMWFIFPQIKGLGSSPISIRFAISSLEEAKTYLNHPLLGPRLIDCTQLVFTHPDRSAHQIFGSPDDLKFHSSLTLFACAADQHAPFRRALQKFFAGNEDSATLRILHTP